MQDKHKGAKSARAAILAAAAKIVREKGASALTLEAAARGAGVSKGGLLYHFASKDELIGAMVEELSNRLLGEVRELQTHLKGRGSLTRAIIEHTEQNAGHADKLPVALLAALGSNATLLAPARQMSKERFEALHDDGIAFEIAAIANLAADGLWFMELLGITPFDTDERKRIFAALRGLVADKAAEDKSQKEHSDTAK